MKHVISLRFVIQRWRELAMQDGYTLHDTLIYGEPTAFGYLPAFVGKDGTHIVVSMAAHFPTADAARVALRNVLWGAHVENRINLLPDPEREEWAA